MAIPWIGNRHPVPEATGMLLEEDYRLSLRDSHTRIDKATLRTEVAYSRANFTANLLLPEDDPAVEEFGNSFVATFSDVGATPAAPEVTRALVAGRLQLVRPGAGALMGAQVVASLASREVQMGEVTLRPVTTTSGAAGYFAEPNYQGVCAGFVHGPTKKGMFVFLVDDGFVKTIRISPADDGSSTRPGSVLVVYDWTLGVAVKTVWNTQLDTVDVYIRDVDDAEADATQVYSAVLSAEPNFIAGVALGNVGLGPTDAASNEIFSLVNLDSPTPGDEMRSDFIRAFGYGRLLLNAGAVLPGVYLEMRPSDIVEADFSKLPEDALIPWQSDLQGGNVGVELTSDGVRIDKLDGTANGDLLGYLARDEPSMDFLEGVWLEAELMGTDVDHLTSESSGIGVEILDGANALLLAFLDNYATKSVGVLQAGLPYLKASYAAGAEVTWDLAAQKIRLWANPDLDRVDVFIGDDDTPYASGQVSALPADATSPQIRIGHVDSFTGRPAYGKVEFRELRYSTNARGYDAVEAVVPDLAALAWTRVATGPGSDAVVGGELQLVDSGFGGAGQRRYFWRTVPSYSTLLGMSVEARFLISAYQDPTGALNPLNTSVAAGPLLDTGIQSVQLRFVSAAAGKFAYIPGATPDDSRDAVIAQSAAGQAISTPVDFSVAHTYRLERKPEQAIRLFVDGVEKITIPWRDVDLPGSVFGPGVGFGSFEGDSATTTHWRRVIYFVGDGYDMAVRPVVPFGERARMFGSLSELVVQVEGI